MAKNSKSVKKKKEEVYQKPKLTKLGNMAQVTKKSGFTTDVGHPTRP